MGFPQLNTSQNEVKRSVKEWHEDIKKLFIAINQEDERFIRKFDSYYDSMDNFIDDITEKDKEKDKEIDKEKEKFLKMLTALKKQNQIDVDNIQNTLNKLGSYKTDLGEKTKDLNLKADKGYSMLSDDKTGRRASLLAEIEKNKKIITADLGKIAELPDSITKSALSVFAFAYKTGKTVLDAATESAMAAVTKGQALNEEWNGIKKQMTEGSKTDKEIADAETAFWEKHKGEKAAAAAAAGGKFDFSKAIDPVEIKKFMDELKETSKISQAQVDSLNDISVKNQEIYEMSKDLKIADIQAGLITDMKENYEGFNNRISSQIKNLTAHKEDIEKIGKVISNLEKEAKQPELNKDEL